MFLLFLNKNDIIFYRLIIVSFNFVCFKYRFFIRWRLFNKIFIKFYFINVLCIIMIGRKMMIEYFCGEDEIEYIINEFDYSYDLLKLYR